MGRPIKEKYFGNTNSPYSNQAVGGTTGLGGEGVASITTATAGSININDTYRTFPALTATAPQLPGGTTAVTAVTWEVDTVTITTGTGYTTGTITSITGLDTQAVTPTRFTVTAPAGVPAFNAFTNRGEYTSVDGTGIATWNVVGPTGTNAQATVKFRVKAIALATAGSGYTSAPSLSWGSLNGTTPSGQTPTLTSSQQNAIKGLAWVPGGSAKLFDIKKQEGSKRYLVNTADGRAICKLVTTPTIASGEMNIIASDTNGSTYFVKKLTARRAVLVQSTATGSFVFADGSAAGWTLGAAATGIVSVANN